MLMSFFIKPLHAVELPDFSILAEEQGNKVVNISSIVERRVNQSNVPFQDERMQEFFKRFGIPNFPGIPPQGGEQSPQESVNGTGSGFIIESNGYIITNAHVVAQADTVVVKLADKREFKAEILRNGQKNGCCIVKN
jgi:serine protease Do